MSCRWPLPLGAALLALAALPSASDVAKPTLVQGKYCPHKAVTRHFSIEFSVPEKTGSTYADLCEKAYRKFCRIFPVRSDEAVWEGKCHIFLFQNRTEFVHFAANVHGRTAALSGGYTTIDKQDPVIVLFLHSGDHTKLKQTLVHEMTHVFLDLFRSKGHVKTWLHEGFAQYFEFQHQPAQSRMAISKQIVKAMVRRHAHRPLALFWNSYFAPTDLASYAQAWSLVEFMAGSKARRKKTGKFITKIKQGRSQEQALREAFGVSLAQLQAMWEAYVLESY